MRSRRRLPTRPRTPSPPPRPPQPAPPPPPRGGGAAPEPLAALGLEQLDDGGEPLLAGSLRQRDTLDRRRPAPRCRHGGHTVMLPGNVGRVCGDFVPAPGRLQALEAPDPREAHQRVVVDRERWVAQPLGHLRAREEADVRRVPVFDRLEALAFVDGELEVDISHALDLDLDGLDYRYPTTVRVDNELAPPDLLDG